MKIKSSPRLLHNTSQGATASGRLAGDRHNPPAFHTFPEWPGAHTHIPGHTASHSQRGRTGPCQEGRAGGPSCGAADQLSDWTRRARASTRSAQDQVTARREDEEWSWPPHSMAHEPRPSCIPAAGPAEPLCAKEHLTGTGACGTDTANVHLMSAQGERREPSNVRGVWEPRPQSTTWTHRAWSAGHATPSRTQEHSASPTASPRPVPVQPGHLHSPASLVVKEENEEQLLVSLGLHVLTYLQHVQRRGRDGDPVVVARHTWHLGVDDLSREDTCRPRLRARPPRPRTLSSGSDVRWLLKELSQHPDSLHTRPSAGAHRTPVPTKAADGPRTRGTGPHCSVPWLPKGQPHGPPSAQTRVRAHSPLPRSSPGPDRRGSHCTWPTRLSEARERRPQHPLKSTCCSDRPLGRERKDAVSHQEGRVPSTSEETPAGVPARATPT